MKNDVNPNLTIMNNDVNPNLTIMNDVNPNLTIINSDGHPRPPPLDPREKCGVGRSPCGGLPTSPWQPT